jgi:hypothetical protein
MPAFWGVHSTDAMCWSGDWASEAGFSSSSVYLLILLNK